MFRENNNSFHLRIAYRNTYQGYSSHFGGGGGGRDGGAGGGGGFADAAVDTGFLPVGGAGGGGVGFCTVGGCGLPPGRLS